MTQPVFEIVSYVVTDIDRAEAARRKAQDALSRYPGFLSWTRYTSVEADRRFVDQVEWASLANAKAAQEAFMTDPAMADFIAATEEVLSMSHVKQLD
tara:strand:+ start:20700 stop:20990 length:291 start_codon:yes stop_codon:yes gene_type:complete